MAVERTFAIIKPDAVRKKVAGQILVVGVDRGGTGFIPVAGSTFQEGDHAALVVHKDALETLDDLLTPIGEH